MSPDPLPQTRLQALSSWRLLAVLLGLYALLEYLLLHTLGSGAGGKPLDLMLHYSPAQAYDYLDGLGAAGRIKNARTHATLDLAYPLVYSSLLVVLITLLCRTLNLAGRLWRMMALLPFAILAFDLAENGTIIVQALRFPAHITVLAQAGSLFTTFKWLFAAVVIGTTLMLLLALMVRTTRRLLG